MREARKTSPNDAREFAVERYQPDRLGGLGSRQPWRARAAAALEAPFVRSSFASPRSIRAETLGSLLGGGLHGPWWGTSGPAYRRVFQRWSDNITEDFGPRTEITRDEAEQLGKNLVAVADVIEQNYRKLSPLHIEARDGERMDRMIVHLREVARAVTELSWAIHPQARVDLTKPLVEG